MTTYYREQRVEVARRGHDAPIWEPATVVYVREDGFAILVQMDDTGPSFRDQRWLLGASARTHIRPIVRIPRPETLTECIARHDAAYKYAARVQMRWQRLAIHNGMAPMDAVDAGAAHFYQLMDLCTCGCRHEVTGAPDGERLMPDRRRAVPLGH